MSEFGKRARSATWDQLRAAAPHRLTDEDIDLIWLALPNPLLPDDDTAVERLAAALDGRTAWHRKRDATLIIERLREGGRR